MRRAADWEGVLPVLKPAHFTSHDVVAKIRKITGFQRVGHTGTLDPLVTGVLPICIGRATRIVEYIQELPKQYEATMTIGWSTDTEDASGHLVASVPPADIRLNEAEIRAAMSRFVGTLSQTPPMYSAVKVAGKKLYELARLGKEVERPAKTIHIYALDTIRMELSANGYFSIRFRVSCSKGTYIRTLCVDIGKSLGYPAVMTSLIRTGTAGIQLEQCLTLEQIEHFQQAGQLAQQAIATDRMIRHLPQYELDSDEEIRARNGLKIERVRPFSATDGSVCRVYNPMQQFIGLFIWDHSQDLFVPHKIWSTF
jgi:tRNA pseudouridine55 synthase